MTSHDRYLLETYMNQRELREPYEGATVCRNCKELFTDDEVKVGNYDGEYEGTDVDDEGGAYECWKFWHRECPKIEAERKVA